MFTGIIQAVGRVAARVERGGDLFLEIDAGRLALGGAGLGDSIAVNGVCLTVAELSDKRFTADVSRETLSQSTLGDLRPGSPVNLETALTLKTPLGGHLVSGHVDGVGYVRDRREDARSVRFRIEAPRGLTRYIAARGSICVDGVSLTVTEVDGALFGLNLVPHTLRETITRGYGPGTRVNIEVDLIARYLERLLVENPVEQGVTRRLLADRGFL